MLDAGEFVTMEAAIGFGGMRMALRYRLETGVGIGSTPRMAVPGRCTSTGAATFASQGAVSCTPMDDDPLIETSGPLFDRVAEAIEQIRPHIQADGGDVRLVEIEDSSIAIVQLLGACVGCPMSQITVRHGIEGTLRVLVPEIMGVDVLEDEEAPAVTFTDVLDRASFKPL
jgi:Fe-S cluster biogenesis protein NfuA